MAGYTASEMAKRLAACLVLFLVLLPDSLGLAARQGDTQVWDLPQNLSQSGAASEPRLLAGPNGELQVFWWDRFDGLITSWSTDQAALPDSKVTWSPPAKASLVSTSLKKPPFTVVDSGGKIHAFWIEGQPDGPLMHSEIFFGSATWSMPDTVTDSAVAFDASVNPDGQVILAFIRAKNNPQSPPGVYVATLIRGKQQGWSSPVSVYSSIYFREVTDQNAWVRVDSVEKNSINLVWTDPHLQQSFFSYSKDNANTWSAVEALGQANEVLSFPRVIELANRGILRIWQSNNLNACTLFQEQSTPSTDVQMPTQWNAAVRILPNLTACPSNDRFSWGSQGLFWFWGLGSDNLFLSTMPLTTSQWTEPAQLNFQFEDPATSRKLALGQLDGTLWNNHLVVVGADANSGEIYVTQSLVTTDYFISAPPSPWSSPVRVQASSSPIGIPAMVMDADNSVHLIWSASISPDKDATALFYSRWDGKGLSTPVIIEGGGDTTQLKQPALLGGLRGQIYLAWVGGRNGTIFFSRTDAREAGSPTSWVMPVEIKAAGVASWPKLGIDGDGMLYLAYIVPLNEGRGLYLVRSSDDGETWTEPVKVFDAQAAGWQMIDHPALSVSPDGLIHTAWVQSSLPGTYPPEGIYYSQSVDQGQTWNTPVLLASQGSDWPQLALANNQVHILYSNTANGVVWHRWKPFKPAAEAAADSELSWTAASLTWVGIDAPFGIAVDGLQPWGTLHFAGITSHLDQPEYSAWNGNRWTTSGILMNSKNPNLNLGMAAATRPEGGTLAIAWLSPQPDSENMDLYFITRAISLVNISTSPVLKPSPQPSETPQPSPTPTPDSTATPAIAPEKPVGRAPALGINPVVLSGGLAFIIVVFAFFTRTWILRVQR